MDPIQVMKELLGYPYVGESCRAVVKIVQQVQTNAITKAQALTELADIKSRVKGKEGNFPEHQRFNSAYDDLVNNITEMA